MTATHRELHRLSNTLIARGLLLVLLGVAALVWPEPFLVTAMVLVGTIAVLFGLYEISIAVAIRRQEAEWRMVLVHGLVVVLFGLLTAGAPALPLLFALGVIAAWFFLYAGVALAGATLPWPRRVIRWALILWGAFDIALAVLTILYPLATTLALLGFGAVYAALFGAWQIAAGVWLRRNAEGAARSLSAKPRVRRGDVGAATAGTP